MEDILTWLSEYSPPIVLLIILSTILIYFIKQVTEKSISNQFDKYKKDIELKLERRSKFEERVLIDRYTLIKEIQTKIGAVSTNLNRIKSGHEIDDFIINGDIVPLTEVFEILAANKYLITDRFHNIFWKQSHLLIKYANEKDPIRSTVIQKEFVKLLDTFYHEMNEMFQIDHIKFEA